MGDSRFHLKVEFSIYGKDFTWDASLNYSPDYDSDCDRRIAEWFGQCYREAKADYDSAIYESQKAERAEALEAKERAKLAELQAKYGPAVPQGGSPK